MSSVSAITSTVFCIMQDNTDVGSTDNLAYKQMT